MPLLSDGIRPKKVVHRGKCYVDVYASRCIIFSHEQEFSFERHVRQAEASDEHEN